MAAISVTPGSVLAGTTGNFAPYNAGGTITAGQLVYVAADGDVEPARANNAATDAIAGVALNGGSAGQPIKIQTSGAYTVGGTVAVGEPYFLSDAVAGEIIPDADLGTGDYVSLFGVGISATQIQIHILNTGITHA